MTWFRHRGLEVAVDTTAPAEIEFADKRISAEAQERIALNLKTVPHSPRDRYYGSIRIRELEGWDVAFVIAREGRRLIVTIMGVERPGEVESHLDLLMRAGFESLPPAAKTLLSGRRKKS